MATHDWKKSCFSSVWSLWPIECNGNIDNTIGVTKVMTRHYLDMSRHCLGMSRYIYMSSDCVDTFRHCLDIQTPLYMARHINIVYTHQDIAKTPL